jgi:predicted ester cyclase
MSEANKAVIRKWIDGMWNQNNVALVEELFAPEWVNHTPGGDMPGLDSIRKNVPGRWAEYPDLHMTVEDMLAEGDKVTVRVGMTGTKEGKRVETWYMTIRRLAGGKMVEGWTVGDSEHIKRQLGQLS